MEESSREGALRAVSYVRPGKLFTGNTRLMTSRVGDLEAGLSHGFVQVVMTMLQKGIALNSDIIFVSHTATAGHCPPSR